MNDVILAVSWFLAKILNPVIVILAIVEAVLMIMAYNKMIALKRRIDSLNGETPGKQVLRSKKAGIVETEYTVKVKKDWKEFDRFCDDYQNDSMLFSSVSLIIQIFPLLGILGMIIALPLTTLILTYYQRYIVRPLAKPAVQSGPPADIPERDIPFDNPVDPDDLPSDITSGDHS